MVQKHGFAPPGAAEGAVKSAIFGYNSARLYKLDLRAELPLISRDKMTAARAVSLHAATRSNLAYGYIAAPHLNCCRADAAPTGAGVIARWPWSGLH
jgi:hypothetical protein